MTREEANTQTARSCRCPFCDEPLCHDLGDGSYLCSVEGNLSVHRVDCVGLYCPVPVMQAKEEIDRLGGGELMELIADDPASLEDIPRWAKRAGHNYIGMKRDGDEYHYLIQKKKYRKRGYCK